MALPETPRMIYKTNPLIEVTCQFRFPTILKISSRPPAAFQDQIRNQFPHFGLSQDSKTYQFMSEDRAWLLVLEQGFLALTAKRYDRWENFRLHLEGPFAALCKLYNPAFLSRVGLRYANLIRRSALGLGKEGWGKLLNQQATGALSWPDVAGEITGTRNEVLISMNGSDSRLRVSHGLVNLQGTDEQCYLIDNDFFVEGKIDSGDALNRLDGFHKDAGRFFRWWVSDKLQKVMGPQAP